MVRSVARLHLSVPPFNWDDMLEAKHALAALAPEGLRGSEDQASSLPQASFHRCRSRGVHVASCSEVHGHKPMETVAPTIGNALADYYGTEHPATLTEAPYCDHSASWVRAPLIFDISGSRASQSGNQ